jgi:hypothetical protein
MPDLAGDGSQEAAAKAGAATPPADIAALGRRALTSDPLVVAIFAAAAAGLFNVLVSLYNGENERKLESLKDDNALIVESIKTGSAQAKDNLLFLANNGLLSKARADALKKALSAKNAIAPSLPANPAAPAGAAALAIPSANFMVRAGGQTQEQDKRLDACMAVVSAKGIVSYKSHDRGVPDENQIRYFHNSDLASATRLGEILAGQCSLGAFKLINLSDDEADSKSMPNGSLEVWFR